MPTRRGSIRLFKFAGITVYIHWMWFLLLLYSIQFRAHAYSSLVWNALEFLALFAIVLIHEFGHQLACRSVGGQTHDIVLWFLGGVAYVSPPQRPGAQLWSIAAGPLVNVVLIPILTALLWLSGGTPNLYGFEPNEVAEFLKNVWWINVILLIFNMLPIYPLDGGQILRSLLWFVFGRATSLLIATIIGFIGAGGFVLYVVALFVTSSDTGPALRLGLLVVFMLMACWGGLRQALALGRIAKMPRRDGLACPVCKTAPPVGPVWRCGRCRQPFDIFATSGTCPHCGTVFNVTQCLDCGSARPLSEWMASSAPPPPIIDT